MNEDVVRADPSEDGANQTQVRRLRASIIKTYHTRLLYYGCALMFTR